MRKILTVAFAIASSAILLTSAQSSANEYWTTEISEEHSHNEIHCRQGYAVAGVACEGSYCDNMSFLCRYTGQLGPWGWSNWFSEENHGVLNSSLHVTGVSCKGRYCDDVSIYYSQGPHKQGHCYTTNWTSEENPPVQCQWGYTVSGMSCSGSYCDNVQLTCCR
jgi:hypothetical protein